MEEMQKAFNKTIIKLQNTSRIAEEQVSNERAQNQFIILIKNAIESLARRSTKLPQSDVFFQKLSALGTEQNVLYLSKVEVCENYT